MSPPLAQAQAILTIDLDALAANWRTLRDRCAPAECAAVIKADGYGLGIGPVARALANAGCTTFFVAHPSEGARARAALAGRACRIFTLNGLLPGADVVQAMVDHQLQPVLGSFAELATWAAHAGDAALRLPFALQFSTGMNRLGFAPKDAAEVAGWLAAHPHMPAAFVMSHFVSSEEPDNPLNGEQIEAFAKIRAAFSDLPSSLPNSSGLYLPQAPYGDLARPGVALYGANPCPGLPNPMRRVVRLETRIIQLREVKTGEKVGYNATWTARRPSRIAICGIGYADGLLRSAMNTDQRAGARFAVGGQLCPIAGRVSMDLTTVDVTDAPADLTQPGMCVEVLGPTISVDDLAGWAGTISYEILTSLGPRYHRVYTGDGAG
jgi:alanine racemase